MIIAESLQMEMTVKSSDPEHINPTLRATEQLILQTMSHQSHSVPCLSPVPTLQVREYPEWSEQSLD